MQVGVQFNFWIDTDFDFNMDRLGVQSCDLRHLNGGKNPSHPRLDSPCKGGCEVVARPQSILGRVVN